MATQYDNTTRTGQFSITHFLVRILVGAVVLAITAALTPGFSFTGGLWSIILAAVVLAALDYLVTRLLGLNATPFGRGITGFIMAAIIIYITAALVVGFTVTFWGVLLGALVYGVVDLILPGRAM